MARSSGPKGFIWNTETSEGEVASEGGVTQRDSKDLGFP
jgi:hypothetical protein